MASDAGHYDTRFGAHAIQILPGEYLVTAEDVMLVTLLGSCVSACIHDPMAKVGGMNHFMLPESAGGVVSETARYGGYAMEILVNELLKRGARRDRMQAKIFGGGAVLPGLSVNIGVRNAQFAVKFLATEGIALVAQDLLDVHPRRVHYFPHTGRAFVRRLAPAQEVEVLSSEKRYLDRLRESPTDGTVELFEEPRK